MGDFKKFSSKQLRVLTWWEDPLFRSFDAIICDGAVRSGKTSCMSISFAAWAMKCFSETSFAICGKTITSIRRNVVVPLIKNLRDFGFECKEKASSNYFDVTFRGRTNRFYIFGGKDEGSAALIQGMTLGGVLLDEVVLMPRTFVEQALARCSLNGSRLWFNCNPENPSHWFYTEWIMKKEQKNALYIHFEMSDNPSLSPKVLKRYKALYSGVFYERFVLGKWTAQSGVVYPMFDYRRHMFTVPPICSRFAVSCDYGTVNPSSFGLWGESGGVWYRLAEYYFDSKTEGRLCTDEEHYSALEKLIGDRKVEAVVCDPSAASFIECIRRHGKFPVRQAKNDVLNGIRRVSDALLSGKIKFSVGCKDALREFSLYRWDESRGCDSVKKENDHAMDDIRYFVSEFLGGAEDSFFVASVKR